MTILGIVAIVTIALFGGSLRGSVLDDRVLGLSDQNRNGMLSVGEMRRGIVAVFRGIFTNNLAYDLNESSTTDRSDLRLFIQSIRSYLTAVCGNGAMEAGEKCDDGNTVSGDGCSSTCVAEAMDYGDLNKRENWGDPIESHDGHCVYERVLSNGKRMITDVHYTDPAHPC